MTFIIDFIQEVAVVGTLLFTMLFQSQPITAPVIVGSGTTTALVVAVIDGDTIDVVPERGGETVRVRYIGIDTPEPYREDVPECGSAEASNRNKELVHNQTVTLVPGADPYDKYGRLLAYVYVKDIFVNETLIAEGLASVIMIEPNTQYETRFRELYKKARIDKRGIWIKCD